MSLKSPAFVMALAVVLAATGGAAAKTYQKSKTFTCAPLGFSGICKATFPKIKSGQRLTITHVSCVIGISNVGQEVICQSFGHWRFAGVSWQHLSPPSRGTI